MSQLQCLNNAFLPLIRSHLKSYPSESMNEKVEADVCCFVLCERPHRRAAVTGTKDEEAEQTRAIDGS